MSSAPKVDTTATSPEEAEEPLLSHKTPGKSPSEKDRQGETVFEDLKIRFLAIFREYVPNFKAFASVFMAAAVMLTVFQWWFFNIAVIIINKWIFQEFHFTFPLTLTCVHFAVSWAGAHISIHGLKLSPLIAVERADLLPRILPLAAVTCVNIVLGNVSLRYIPVSFVQTIKALTPATTVLLQVLFWGKKFHSLVYVSLLPVVGGMVLASFTELSFVLAGFLAAIASCFITSTGVILAEILLSGKYKFDSLNTVYYMVPYGLQLLVVPAVALEGRAVREWALRSGELFWPALAAVVASGALAFGLNFSLYAVIKVTSAVTFNVVGNFKVAVAVLCSWLVFRNPMNLLNILGCAITVGGCTYYGYLQHHFAQQAKAASSAAQAQAGPAAPGKQPLAV